MKTSSDADDMQENYDFSGAVRGKHVGKFSQGYTIRIHHEDGRVTEQHVAKPLESHTDWERLAKMTDDEIDYSDIPEITPEQFATAQNGEAFARSRGKRFDTSKEIKMTQENSDGTTTTIIIPPKKQGS